MLRIAVHSSNDIQWFVWQQGVLEIQEGSYKEVLAQNVQTLVEVERLLRVYMIGAARAITSDKKTHPA